MGRVVQDALAVPCAASAANLFLISFSVGLVVTLGRGRRAQSWWSSRKAARAERLRQREQRAQLRRLHALKVLGKAASMVVVVGGGGGGGPPERGQKRGNCGAVVN